MTHLDSTLNLLLALLCACANAVMTHTWSGDSWTASCPITFAQRTVISTRLVVYECKYPKIKADSLYFTRTVIKLKTANRNLMEDFPIRQFRFETKTNVLAFTSTNWLHFVWVWVCVSVCRLHKHLSIIPLDNQTPTAFKFPLQLTIKCVPWRLTNHLDSCRWIH